MTRGPVGGIAGYIEDNALDGDQSRTVGIGSYTNRVSWGVQGRSSIRGPTIALGQFLRGDGIILGRVELDRHLRRKALGLRLVFDHCVRDVKGELGESRGKRG